MSNEQNEGQFIVRSFLDSLVDPAECGIADAVGEELIAELPDGSQFRLQIKDDGLYVQECGPLCKTIAILPVGANAVLIRGEPR